MAIKNALSIQNLNSIAGYWKGLKPKNNIDTAVEESWKKKVEFLDHISTQNNVVVFLWNAFTNRFIYMSDKVKVMSGLDPELYTAEDGVAYSMSRMHPDHLAAGLELHKNMLNYCEENKIQGAKDVSLSLNYLCKNGNDEYVQVLQQDVVLESDSNGKPSLALSFIHYVGHIKKQDSIGGVIVSPGGTQIFNYHPGKKSFDKPKIISDQERKIIDLLARGFDTKSIAQMLFISPFTVNTHRRNLIKKTECLDATGVVAFAKLINLI
jgi:DNA-binding CsgD family transcriptional regulator